MIHKTFTKKDLLEIIQTYDIPIEDPKQYNKNDLSMTLTELLITEDYEISFSPDYPDFFKNDLCYHLQSIYHTMIFIRMGLL